MTEETILGVEILGEVTVAVFGGTEVQGKCIR